MRLVNWLVNKISLLKMKSILHYFHSITSLYNEMLCSVAYKKMKHDMNEIFLSSDCCLVRNIVKGMRLIPLLFIVEELQPCLGGPSLPSASRAITQQAVGLSAQQTRSTATVLLI